MIFCMLEHGLIAMPQIFIMLLCCPREGLRECRFGWANFGGSLGGS